MAKKDKKDEEYKDENLHNEPEQDDEDFGLPDLDDDTESSDNFDSDTDSSTDSDESEQETSFDTSETSQETVSADQEEEYDSNPFGDEEEERVSTYTPPKKQSAAPIIITLSIIVIIACALVYYFFLREPQKEPVANEPVKDKSSYVVEKPVEPEPEVIESAEPVVGEVNTLNSRTGRSYVVVGSFFDEDLAKDYAGKLTKDGTNAYIIPPFGKSKFNRVAIEETESFAKASTRATELSGQYKEQPWPLKY